MKPELEIYDVEYIVGVIEEEIGKVEREQIEYYIILSHNMIKNYLWANDGDMVENGEGKFQYEVIQLILYFYREVKRGNLSQKTQGERSETYFISENIPPHIKVLLPTPYARSVF